MKTKFIIVFLFLCINTAILAKEQVYGVDTTKYNNEEFTCFKEWVIYKGKKYRPNEEFSTLIISFEKKMDFLKLETPNMHSYYNYDSYLALKDGRLGMTYSSTNKNGDKNIIDLFNDGTMMLFVKNKPYFKAICPQLKLNVKKQ